MKSSITESEVEEKALDVLGSLNYEIINGGEEDYLPGGKKELREGYKEVVLKERLFKALKKLNPGIPKQVLEEAVKKIIRISNPNQVEDNQNFHKLLVEGITVSYRKEGKIKHEQVKVIEFDPEKANKNDFLATNQFTIIENSERRPDIILFVNGLPLVLFELKNLADEKADVYEAFKQIQTYKQEISSLFRFNEICIISDGQDARAGTLNSNFDRFMPWKTINGKKSKGLQLDVLIKGMLNKQTLLGLIKSFIVYEKERDVKENTTKLVKKLAAYHQYNAVNKAYNSTIKATQGNKKAGVVWHTQGSGKSISMVFYTGKLALSDELKNPTIVVITDRNDLDGQLFGTFTRCSGILRQKPIQAQNRDDLKEKLTRSSGGIIFTTIQKFFPQETREKFPCLSKRKNIIVIADEAHRTQYGFKAKIDKKQGRITYGFAKYMRDALPNASFIGFTGTPIEKEDRNTKAVFVIN